MGNSNTAGPRSHGKPAKEEHLGGPVRRPRAASASAVAHAKSTGSQPTIASCGSPSPRPHHHHQTQQQQQQAQASAGDGAGIIESPREDRAEMLSRLIAEFESDRLKGEMKEETAGVGRAASPIDGALRRSHSPNRERLMVTTSGMSGSRTTPELAESAKAAERQLQCLFKWAGGGRKVFLAGAFTDPPWQARIPMHRSKSANFYTIYNLSVGLHDYCFVVDGQWRVDTKQPLHPGGKPHHHQHQQAASLQQSPPPPQTNCLEVKESDFEVFNALEADFAEASDRQRAVKEEELQKKRLTSPFLAGTGRPGSPQGEYTREVPSPARLLLEATDHPPLLPPVLLDGILNADTSARYDPNLMPVPQHVMLNHLYCLSIKDGMMILASTARYRKKFVSTVLYRPIAADEKPGRRHSEQASASASRG